MSSKNSLLTVLTVALITLAIEAIDNADWLAKADVDQLKDNRPVIVESPVIRAGTFRSPILDQFHTQPQQRRGGLVLEVQEDEHWLLKLYPSDGDCPTCAGGRAVDSEFEKCVTECVKECSRALVQCAPPIYLTCIVRCR